jgi:uncharacterized glyoxalase superfamily metalloenzyme YdcJ
LEIERLGGRRHGAIVAGDARESRAMDSG